ncbi:hypothetical protein [Falsiroseomonas oryzae]|uniref:hypothetical protein n=1 Tax=Falsiroseomonas oryzae TaxID=2766473 RepID=UPI0022EA4370|nr:hypothetical protein [Roseomonas sp. MO-31]
MAGQVTARGDGTGATVRGGLVAVQAKDGVAVLGGAKLDASGTGGGGTVLAGTTGIGRAQSMAKSTVVEAGAELRADATARGDGGTIVVNSSESTSVLGRLAARGGPEGGDGGFIEVSSQGALTLGRDVQLDAPAGQGGTLLIDPDVINIVESGGLDGQPPTGGANPGLIAFTDAGTGTIDVDAAAINGFTGGTRVLLQANNTINVNAAINRETAGDVLLETGAAAGTSGTINVNRSIIVSEGMLGFRTGTLNITSNPGQAAAVALLASTNVTVTAATLNTTTPGASTVTIEAPIVSLRANSVSLGGNTTLGGAATTLVEIGPSSAASAPFIPANTTTISLATGGTLRLGETSAGVRNWTGTPAPPPAATVTADSLTLAGAGILRSGTNVELIANNLVRLEAPVNVGTASLTLRARAAAGAVQQTAAVTAGALSGGAGSGGFVLDLATNALASLGSIASGGNVLVNNTGALSVTGAVTAAAAGSARISTTGGLGVTSTGSVTAGSLGGTAEAPVAGTGQVHLWGNGIVLAGPVTGGAQVSLTSSSSFIAADRTGSVTQSGAGTVTAGALLTSAASVSLPLDANRILAANALAQSGAIAIRSDRAVQVPETSFNVAFPGNPGATYQALGINALSGDVRMAAPALTVTGLISAQGDATREIVLIADSLAFGSADRLRPGAVGTPGTVTLTRLTAGNIAVFGGSGLAVGSAALDAIDFASRLRIGGGFDGATLAPSGVGTSTVQVNGAVNATLAGIGTLDLRGVSVTQAATAAGITVATLEGTAGSGGFSIGGDGNAITQFGPITAAGNSTLRNVAGLVVGGAVNVGTATLSLRTNNGGISQTQAITAGTIAAQATTTVVLDAAANNFANIGEVNAGGDIRILTGTGPESVTVTGAVVSTGAGTVRIETPRPLLVSATGSVTSSSLGGGNVHLWGQDIALAGPVTGGASVTLVAFAGSMTSTAGATAPANIAQSGLGAITTRRLGIVAVGTTTLGLDNAVEEVSADTGGAVTLRSTRDLTTGGAVALFVPATNATPSIPAGLETPGLTLSAPSLTITQDITSVGGNVLLEARGGTPAGSRIARAGGLISAPSAGSSVTLRADTVLFGIGTAVSANTTNGAVVLEPFSNATNLVVNAASGLGQITAQTLSLRSLGRGASPVAGAVQFSGTLDFTTVGTLDLRGASVTQTGGTLAVGRLQGATTVGDFDVSQLGNAIGTLGPVDAQGAVRVSTNDTLTVAGPVSGSAVTLQAGALSLTGTVDTGAGLVDLLASTGDVTQGGAITAGSLRARALAGSVLLDTVANEVSGDVAGTAGVAFRLRTANGLAIGTAGAGNGITAPGVVDLLADAGDIAQTRAITAGTLRARALAGSVVLDSVANPVLGVVAGSAAGSTAGTPHGFAFQDSSGLVVGSVAGTDGISAPGTVRLVATSGSVTQSQAITAGTIAAEATTTVVLDAAANNFAGIGEVNAGGDIRILTGTGPVSVTVTGAVVSTGAGTVRIETPRPLLVSATGSVTSNSLGGGNVHLWGQSISLAGPVTGGSSVTLVAFGGSLNGTAGSTAPATITQSGLGVITTRRLGVSAVGTTDLGLDNGVEEISARSAAAVTLRSTRDLATGAAVGIFLPESNTASAIPAGLDAPGVTLSAPSIAVTQNITSNGGNVLLEARGGTPTGSRISRAAGLISAPTAGTGVTLRADTIQFGIGTAVSANTTDGTVIVEPFGNATNLVVNAASGLGQITAQTLSLRSLGRGASPVAGAVQFSGTLDFTTVGTLDLRGASVTQAGGTLSVPRLQGATTGGDFNVSQPGNTIGTLGPVDAQGSVNVASTGTLTVAGPITGSLVFLRAGALALTGTVDASGLVLLASTGDVTQSGVITTGVMHVDAPNGSVLLDTVANELSGNVAGTAGAAFRLRTANGLAVGTAGIANGITAPGVVDLLADAGDITQTRAINAGTLRARALAGSVVLDSVANPVLGAVAGSAAGSTAGTPHGFAFQDSSGLVVGSVAGTDGISAPGTVRLVAAAGSVTQSQAVAAGTLTAQAAGAVTLAHVDNAFPQIGAVTAGTDIRLFNGAGAASVTVAGAVASTGAGTVRIETARALVVSATGSVTSGTLVGPDAGVVNLWGQDIALAGPVIGGNTVSLAAFGGSLSPTFGPAVPANVTQSGLGLVSTRRLALAAAGDVTLLGDNQVNSVGASNRGNIAFRSVRDLSIVPAISFPAPSGGLVNTGGGLTSLSGGIVLSAPSISVAQAIAASGGNVDLTAFGGTPAGSTITRTAGLVGADGSSRTITLTADAILLSGAGPAIQASTVDGTVVLQPFNNATNLVLGAGTSLGLITARTLEVRSTGSGGAPVPGAIEISGVQALTNVGVLDLRGASVTQTGGTLSVARLQGSASGGDFVVQRPGNSISTLGATEASGAVRIATGGALTVAGSVEGLGVTLSAGALALDAPVDARSGVADLLATTGDITQSAVLTAGALRARATLGSVLLDAAANRVAGEVAGTAGTDFRLRDNDGIAIGSVAPTDGISASGGLVDLRADTGNVTQTQAIAAGSLRVRALDGAVQLGGLNAVTGEVAGSAAGGSNGFAFRNGSGLAVGSVLGTDGISAPGTVDLRADSGNVTQTQAIAAGSLRARALAGAVQLGGLNAVTGEVAGSAAGGSNGFAFRNGSGLVVGSVSGLDGVSNGISAPGTVDLRADSGNVTQTQAIAAGSLRARALAGAVVLDHPLNQVTGAVAGSAAGGTNGFTLRSVTGFEVGSVSGLDGLSNGISAPGTVDLRSTAGSIVQTQTVSGAALRARADAGSVLLHTVANPIAGDVAGSAGLDFRFRDTDALNVGMVSGTVGITAGGAVLLAGDAGDLTQTRIVSSAALEARAPSGAVTLDLANDVGTFAGQAGGAVTFRSVRSGGVGIGNVSATADSILRGDSGLDIIGLVDVGAANRLDLRTDQPVTQQVTGRIIAGTLDIRGTAGGNAGPVTLGSLNDIGFFTAASSGGVVFVSTRATTIGAVTANGASTLTGIASLTLTDNLNVGTANSLGLRSNGAVSQTGGIMTAGSLDVREAGGGATGAGTITLLRDNQVAGFDAASTGAISLRSMRSAGLAVGNVAADDDVAVIAPAIGVAGLIATTGAGAGITLLADAFTLANGSLAAGPAGGTLGTVTLTRIADGTLDIGGANASGVAAVNPGALLRAARLRVGGGFDATTLAPTGDGNQSIILSGTADLRTPAVGVLELRGTSVTQTGGGLDVQGLAVRATAGDVQLATGTGNRISEVAVRAVDSARVTLRSGVSMTVRDDAASGVAGIQTATGTDIAAVTLLVGDAVTTAATNTGLAVAQPIRANRIMLVANDLEIGAAVAAPDRAGSSSLVTLRTAAEGRPIALGFGTPEAGSMTLAASELSRISLGANGLLRIGAVATDTRVAGGFEGTRTPAAGTITLGAETLAFGASVPRLELFSGGDILQQGGALSVGKLAGIAGGRVALGTEAAPRPNGIASLVPITETGSFAVSAPDGIPDVPETAAVLTGFAATAPAAGGFSLTAAGNLVVTGDVQTRGTAAPLTILASTGMLSVADGVSLRAGPPPSGSAAYGRAAETLRGADTLRLLAQGDLGLGAGTVAYGTGIAVGNSEVRSQTGAVTLGSGARVVLGWGAPGGGGGVFAQSGLTLAPTAQVNAFAAGSGADIGVGTGAGLVVATQVQAGTGIALQGEIRAGGAVGTTSGTISGPGTLVAGSARRVGSIGSIFLDGCACDVQDFAASGDAVLGSLQGTSLRVANRLAVAGAVTVSGDITVGGSGLLVAAGSVTAGGSVTNAGTLVAGNVTAQGGDVVNTGLIEGAQFQPFAGPAVVAGIVPVNEVQVTLLGRTFTAQSQNLTVFAGSTLNNAAGTMAAQTAAAQPGAAAMPAAASFGATVQARSNLVLTSGSGAIIGQPGSTYAATGDIAATAGTAAGPGGMALAGMMQAGNGARVELRAQRGDLAQTGGAILLPGGQISLLADAGSVLQETGARIEAARLTARASGAIQMAGNNRIGTIDAVTAGGAVTLNLAGTPVTLLGPLDAASVSVVADGAVTLPGTSITARSGSAAIRGGASLTANGVTATAPGTLTLAADGSGGLLRLVGGNYTAEYVVLAAGPAGDTGGIVDMAGTSFRLGTAMLAAGGGGVSMTGSSATSVVPRDAGALPLVILETRRSPTALRGLAPSVFTPPTRDVPALDPAQQVWQVATQRRALPPNALVFGVADGSGAATSNPAGAVLLNLDAGQSPLFLLLDGGTASGSLIAGRLGVHGEPAVTVPGTLALDLTGSLNGLDGSAAAQSGRVTTTSPSEQALYRMNGCVLDTINCIAPSIVQPVLLPLPDRVDIRSDAPALDPDVLLPNIAEEDY